MKGNFKSVAVEDYRITKLVDLCDLSAVPRRLTSGSEALKLSGCGSKVADRVSRVQFCILCVIAETSASIKITEYLETGRIEESDSILADSRFQTLREFASVFTIGTSTAVELYDLHGCRSLSDVAEFYADKEGQEWDSGVVGEGVPLAKRKIRYGPDGVLGGRGGAYRWKRKTRDAVRRRQEGLMSKAEICREWMLLQEELDQRQVMASSRLNTLRGDALKSKRAVSLVFPEQKYKKSPIAFRPTWMPFFLDVIAH